MDPYLERGTRIGFGPGSFPRSKLGTVVLAGAGNLDNVQYRSGFLSPRSYIIIDFAQQQAPGSTSSFATLAAQVPNFPQLGPYPG
ncbi:hypothetical protein O988_05686 [Pseudogymnoascus sp. VKM F-3808]|nr:hypothetical protein O988_05686 [Pseudogymnoascus sp. VKM F-3808]